MLPVPFPSVYWQLLTSSGFCFSPSTHHCLYFFVPSLYGAAAALFSSLCGSPSEAPPLSARHSTLLCHVPCLAPTNEPRVRAGELDFPSALRVVCAKAKTCVTEHHFLFIGLGRWRSYSYWRGAVGLIPTLVDLASLPTIAAPEKGAGKRPSGPVNLDIPLTQPQPVSR